MRIVAGKHRGRNITAPQGLDIRPTTDRVRESVFNILEHRDWGKDGMSIFADVRVLDTFCGTGACGLEALSRGAAHVTFLDKSNTALDLCRQTIRILKEEVRTDLLRADCVRPPRPAEQYSLIFMDPPYGENLAGTALENLLQSGWIEHNAICVIETGTNETLDTGHEFSLMEERTYGATRISFIKHTTED